MTESQPTDTGRHDPDRANGRQSVDDGGVPVEHILTCNSLRSV
ncbi:MAG: hypothetical protein M0Z63_14040 [Actinomycetota bacterium]|jgi:hypothetical protein|nr:hypothetical protein [Actinomycetota bacterium]MDA8281508.1 hypothetical protein [Actinomycetota bacterium]